MMCACGKIFTKTLNGARCFLEHLSYGCARVLPGVPEWARGLLQKKDWAKRVGGTP